MNLQQAQRDLLDDSFWGRGGRHRRALECLAQCPAIEAVEVLVGALLAGHRQAREIRRLLSVLKPPGDQPKIDRLWRMWADDRNEDLARVLHRLGCPAQDADLYAVSCWKLGRPPQLDPDPRAVRAALGWLPDRDVTIRKGVLKTLEQLPNDERLNDELVEAWCQRESSELETLIKSQGRKPARPELEALFYLVTGQTKAYQALQDANGQYFLQAFLLAPASFRQRINDTVARSGSTHLVAIYRQAMAGRDGFDQQLYLNALKTAGDEDRLFESLREMKFLDALDFCKRWAENGRLPQDRRRRQAAERAVAAYKSLGNVTFEQGPAPPAGLRDLLAVWQESPPRDANSQDPFVRAHALFSAQQRGGAQIQQAANSDDWPLRLAARLLDASQAAKSDHVEWVGALSGLDADVLAANVFCTPPECERYSQRLSKARQGGTATQRQTRFLEILCSLQSAFVSGGITVDDSGEATERGAVTVEDAPVE